MFLVSLASNFSCFVGFFHEVAGWLGGWVVGWLVGLVSFGWMVDFVGWLASRLVCFVGWLISRSVSLLA
jgi:hypothetical protein